MCIIETKEYANSIGLRYRKYHINDFFFEQIDSHLKAYVLGCFYSDGYLVKEGKGTKRIGIDSIDKEWLEDIGRAMDFTGEIILLKNARGGYSNESSKPLYRFKISSPVLYDTLIKQGCIEHKSKTLLFPTKDQVPKEFISSFICGYMDGNGSVYKHYDKNSNKIYYGLSFCGTKEVIKGIKDFFYSDVKEYDRWPNRDNNNLSVAWNGIKTVYDKLSILYANTPIKLKRKYQVFLELSQDSRITQ